MSDNHHHHYLFEGNINSDTGKMQNRNSITVVPLSWLFLIKRFVLFTGSRYRQKLVPKIHDTLPSCPVTETGTGTAPSVISFIFHGS